ncbi:glycosyltransferase family 4 protein [Streptomyces capitiformicae]|uniref:D-inositol 3-phosphate glycosyltransferase n=1 Tax=Streptomyces capitiformicae TaxID=2014920 RepID=A0A919GHP5_9ACTN|nr:glycosyltransferase family 4 protein [Streptomyces capitiformicae]GHH84739.1 D-inositol 3-phosphate glycosyltransferase [Streptomyces capitiformicae]
MAEQNFQDRPEPEPVPWPEDAVGAAAAPASGDELRPAAGVLRLSPYYYFTDRELTRRELQYEPIGGMQVQITQTTEDVDSLGVPQTVLLPRRPGQPRRLRLGRHSEARLLRLPIAPIRTRSKGYMGLLISWGLAVVAWCLVQRVRRRDRAWSLIHVHCSELPWTFLVALAAGWILRRPVMLTVHCSAIVTFHPETFAGHLLIGPARIAERYALAKATVVVVLTDRIRREYVARGLVSPSRVRVVPDGVRLGQFVPPSAPAEADEPPGAPGEADTPIVLYCGRFAPEKGWYDFVAAADELSNRRAFTGLFVMCGDGNELPHCRTELTRRGLSDRVRLLGHLDRPEVAALMQTVQVVVIPSRHEELGGTVLEALAASRAVVATRVGGLPEVIRDGETGLLVSPREPELIADAVLRLARDPQSRARFGKAGRDYVLSRFDATAVARQLGALYAEIGEPAPARVEPAGSADPRRGSQESA